jgi:aminoglycoside phosphotransferase family enzyme
VTGVAEKGAQREADVSLAQKLAFLAQALPGARRIETHTAYVFVAPDRVLKLKKPICFDYLDYRDLTAREHVCREEIRLNRQLAGEMYLGVVPLVCDEAGRMALGTPGMVIDWLVEMRRLPTERLLETCLRSGKSVTPAEISAVADRLITFYRDRQADRPNPGLYLRHLRCESAVNIRNLNDMRAHLRNGLDGAIVDAGAALIDHHAPEISARDRMRLVIEGHGDLRPEHVCLTTPPTIFDRLEFSVEMRMIDVFDEVNYLGLECAVLGAQWIGVQILAAITAAGFSAPSPGLLRAYGVFRCLTRARLSLDHLRDAVPRTPEKWPLQARSYLMRAAVLLAAGGGG